MMIDIPGFDEEWSPPSDWAEMYRGIGLQVVPAHLPSEDKNYKRPVIAWREWENELTPQAVFDRWYGSGGQYAKRPNMGFVTGQASGGVFCVDLDVGENSQSFAWWQGVLAVHNNGQEPDTPAQRTGGGGRQILFRAPPGYCPPTNKTSIGVDIRGQGGFMMAPPSRHASGKEYAWEDGRAPYELEIEEAPDWLLYEIANVIEKHGGGTGKGPSERAEASGLTNAFGQDTDDREHKMQKAVWARVVDMYRDSPIPPTQAAQEASLKDLWDWYLRTTATRLAPRDGKDKAALLDMEGRGWTDISRRWRYAMKKWDKEVKAAAAQIPEKPEPQAQQAIEPVVLTTEERHERTQRFAPRSFTGEIPPPRPWSYGNFLMSGAVTGVAAPPGVGKTTFSVQLGVAFALDMQLGPWGPVAGGGGRVWLYNGEEPQDELDRRFMAATAEMGVEDAVAAKRFFYNSGLDERLQLVRVDATTKEIQRHPDVDVIKDIIRQGGIKLFILDPLVEFNGADEGGEGLKATGTVMREIANDCQCSVLFFHHTPKTSNSDTAAGDANSLRGAGQLIGSARFISTMFGMTAKDAEEYDVPKKERHQYVRFDDAKANMTVVSGEPQWWVKLGVCIDNGDSVRPSDSIGILRAVTLRSEAGDSMAQQMARATQKEAALDKVAAEMIRVCLNNGNTSPDRAESFDTLMRALDTIKTGVSVNTAKDMVVGGMGEGRISGENRLVISSVQRGKLTARRVYVEPISE